ncbi:hypothetical protein [Pseudomonas duriflava]|uniref:hypothetical protein n=1 Tax=Pseudomonas duriflava TaxID=459528 RepID=UPI0011A33358|nr:hypothetical protein [Pseudomonas duriflava]
MSVAPALAMATVTEPLSLLGSTASSSTYAAACDQLAEALAPLQVWPTIPDRQEAFTFSVLDLYGRVAYRSLRLRRVQYSDPAFLNRVILAAQRALASQGLEFPAWTDAIEKPHNCSAVSTDDLSPPCQTCRLMPCKF